MISAVILAAGQSRRMGTQKLLLPFDGQPMIVRIVDELLRSPVDRVLVVVSRQGKDVQEVLADRCVQVVTNTHAEEEMLYSVRSGLLAVPQGTSGVMVALGDQPGISATVVSDLIQTFHETDRGIVVPTHQGRRGHPLLFAIDYRDEVLAQYEGCGLRGLLDAHPQDVFEVEVTTSGVLEDMDLPEDYQRAIQRLREHNR